MAGLVGLGASGLVLMAIGGVALALGQPYAVWYPLLRLLGLLDSGLAFSLLSMVHRRFDTLGRRRAQTFDAP